jgi:hypothetical protein
MAMDGSRILKDNPIDTKRIKRTSDIIKRGGLLG